MGHKAGEQILAYCSKCKMDLKATIVAMNGAKIAKVTCNTCKTPRSYSAPKGAKEPGAAPTTRKRSSTPTEEREIKTVSVFTEWTNQMSALNQTPRIPYMISTKFKEGDVIAHPTFGEGLVMKCIYPNKVEILFRDDVKTLIHGNS